MFVFVIVQTGLLANGLAKVSVHATTGAPVPTVIKAALSVPTIVGLVPHVPTVGTVPVELTWPLTRKAANDEVAVTSILVEETLVNVAFVIVELFARNWDVDATPVTVNVVPVAVVKLTPVRVELFEYNCEVDAMPVTLKRPVPAVIGPLFVV